MNNLILVIQWRFYYFDGFNTSTFGIYDYSITVFFYRFMWITVEICNFFLTSFFGVCINYEKTKHTWALWTDSLTWNDFGDTEASWYKTLKRCTQPYLYEFLFLSPFEKWKYNAFILFEIQYKSRGLCS